MLVLRFFNKLLKIFILIFLILNALHMFNEFINYTYGCKIYFYNLFLKNLYLLYFTHDILYIYLKFQFK